MALRFALVGAMIAVIGVCSLAISMVLPRPLSDRFEAYGTVGYAAGIAISCVGILAWVWTLIP